VAVAASDRHHDRLVVRRRPVADLLSKGSGPCASSGSALDVGAERLRHQVGEFVVQASEIAVTYKKNRHLDILGPVSLNDWSLPVICDGFRHVS
jgi:hypothetical protein